MVAPEFAIEGTFFQTDRLSGIARVWMNVLAEWRRDGFLDRVVLFDRGGTMPEISDARREILPARDCTSIEDEPELLQAWCDRVGVRAFCSTYYAYPARTPSVALIHDMIPEILGFDLAEPMWREKHALIARARGFVCVSHNTRCDLERLEPEAAARPIAVAHPGIDPAFTSGEPVDPPSRLEDLGVARDYVVFIGRPSGYKGFETLFYAVASLPAEARPQIVVVGPEDAPAIYAEYLGPGGIVRIHATDDGIRLLLAHARAYVAPSRYEGFGLTVLEAMASGCPVVCSDGGSLPEVAGDAALVLPVGDAAAFAAAIDGVRDLRVRNALIARGLRRAGTFSWRPLADVLREALEAAAA